MPDSSDGFWDQSEWRKARDIYHQIWPQEPTRCPWGEVVETEETDDSETNAKSEPLQPQCTMITKYETINLSHILASLHLKRSQLPVRQTVESPIYEVSFRGTLQWLSHCDKDDIHRDCRAPAIQWQNLPGVRFKVIDVSRRCVVDAPDVLSFVVLSYVWGGVDQPKLTAVTAPTLMQDSGLDVLWDRIPATIRDAITVCEKLGERYLWVDALCIMQDSLRDMKIQILRMRQIYSAAKVTIIAASAESAESGLIQGTRGIETADGESLESFYQFIEDCPWSTRAWCYQEKVLSHRAIFFTSAGIYLQCQNGTFTDEGHLLPRNKKRASPAKFNIVGGMLSIPPGADLESYLSAVEYFS